MTQPSATIWPTITAGVHLESNMVPIRSGITRAKPVKVGAATTVMRRVAVR